MTLSPATYAFDAFHAAGVPVPGFVPGSVPPVQLPVASQTPPDAGLSPFVHHCAFYTVPW